MRPYLLLAALISGGTGCAYYAQEDGERLHHQVYGLQTQVNSLQQALGELKKIEEEQKAQLAKMTAEVGELNKSARRNDADLGVQLDEMMQDVGRLKGHVEGFSERLSNLETLSSKVQEELDLRFQGLQEKAAGATAKSEEEKQRAVAEARERERVLASPDLAMTKAQQMIAANQPGEARKLLRELNLRWGEDKKFNTEDRAQTQFLIGETYFAENNFQQAAAEYNTVRKKFPSAGWVADSLYRLGMCFERLNLPDDAKLFYQTVTKKYARSRVAKQAEERLKGMK